MKNQLLLSFLLVGIGACSSGDSSLSILLTDAPGDVSSAVVTVDQIYMQGDSTEGNDRVILRDQPVTTDLLSLSNDVATLVDDQPVPTGTYGQLRFVISGAYVEVDGANGPVIYATPGYSEVPADANVAGVLRTPSWSESGFKVDLPDGALTLESPQRILVVDFDVADSFGQQAGASNAWVMRPTLRASDLKATGSITVQVDANGAPDATMQSIAAELRDADQASEGTLLLSDANQDGIYQTTFRYLDPSRGPFTVSLQTNDNELTTDPAVPVEVSLASGEDAQVEIAIQSF